MISLKGEALTNLKKSLMSVFQMKGLGPAEYFLGIRIIRDRVNRTISLV